LASTRPFGRDLGFNAPLQARNSMPGRRFETGRNTRSATLIAEC